MCSTDSPFIHEKVPTGVQDLKLKETGKNSTELSYWMQPCLIVVTGFIPKKIYSELYRITKIQNKVLISLKVYVIHKYILSCIIACLNFNWK